MGRLVPPLHPGGHLRVPRDGGARRAVPLLRRVRHPGQHGPRQRGVARGGAVYKLNPVRPIALESRLVSTLGPMK